VRENCEGDSALLRKNLRVKDRFHLLVSCDDMPDTGGIGDENFSPILEMKGKGTNERSPRNLLSDELFR